MNTHSYGALYEAFPADVALSLSRRLEIIHTPKHGSWLNIAENELSVLTRQCVKGIRFELWESLRAALESWARSRNGEQKGVHWQFTTADARIKLASLYPKIVVQLNTRADLARHVGNLGDFRLRYFKEYPYLYVGTEAGEQNHTAGYIAEPTARLLIAKDQDASQKIVGVAIGTMLSSESEILKQSGVQFLQLEIIPNSCFYFGEMIIDPTYRNKEIGKRMLKMLKEAGSEQGADRFGFLAVAREPNDVRRPTDYVDSATIFAKFGFAKTDVSVSFTWNTIQPDGSAAQTLNRLDFWIAR